MNSPFTGPALRFAKQYAGSGQVALGTLALRNHNGESCYARAVDGGGKNLFGN